MVIAIFKYMLMTRNAYGIESGRDQSCSAAQGKAPRLSIRAKVLARLTGSVLYPAP